MIDLVITFSVYILLISLSCVLWNAAIDRKYSKKKEKISFYLDKDFINSAVLGSIPLLGTSLDENNDYEFKKAVEEIEMPQATRIKLL